MKVFRLVIGISHEKESLNSKLYDIYDKKYSICFASSNGAYYGNKNLI